MFTLGKDLAAPRARSTQGIAVPSQAAPPPTNRLILMKQALQNHKQRGQLQAMASGLKTTSDYQSAACTSRFGGGLDMSSSVRRP